MGQPFHYAAITEKGRTAIFTEELPELQPDEVLVQLKAANLCTSEYQVFMGARDKQPLPFAGGHEWAGSIVAKGSAVIDDYRIGDQVAALFGQPCNQCEACKLGHSLECEHGAGQKVDENGIYGFKRFADYAIIEARNLVPVSNDVPAAQAALVEPLSSAVKCVKMAGIKPLDDVVVIGAGTMGLLNAMAANAYGARVIITELSPKKLERARAMGFADVVDSSACDPVAEIKRLTGGKGADIVIECVANTKAYEQGYAMLRHMGGKLMLFPAGYPEPELKISCNELHYRLISIIGCFGSNTQDFLDAADLMSKKKVDTSFALEGSSFALRDFQKAMEAACVPDTYRITVDLTEV